MRDRRRADAGYPRTYCTEFVPVFPPVDVGFPGLTAVGLAFAPLAVGLFGLIG
jgi:hypothetical protein